MITEAQIKALLEEKITGTEIFITEVKVKPGNKIVIFADKAISISIEECVEISRFIESKFDREIEDFELEVSSPGLDHPFKVLEQYKKNINKEVSVLTKTGEKHIGKLIMADEKNFQIEKALPKKKKKKEIDQEDDIIATFEYAEVKETKIVLTF